MIRRIITAKNNHGNSYILSDGETTNIEIPLPEMDSRFQFFNLWTTDSMPVNFSSVDPVIDKFVSTSPVKNGSLFRIVNYPPERVLLNQVNKMSQDELIAFEKRVGVKICLNGKHPFMHMTNSIDFGVVLTGEIFLVLEEEETLLKATDTVIQRGTNHAWSNRSEQDCLMAYVLLDALV
ncbi:MAG: cupin domain-containing protein [Enterobacteriaceae bacterium]